MTDANGSTSETLTIQDTPTVEFSHAPFQPGDTQQPATVCSLGPNNAQWIPQTRSETILHVRAASPDLPCQFPVDGMFSAYTREVTWSLAADGALQGSAVNKGYQGSYQCSDADPDYQTDLVSWSRDNYFERESEFSISLVTQKGEQSLRITDDSEEGGTFAWGGTYHESSTFESFTSGSWPGTERRPLGWLHPLRTVVYEGPDKLPPECKSSSHQFLDEGFKVPTPPLPLP
jgi:hypothetical protein